jgi:hypothetical protein
MQDLLTKLLKTGVKTSEFWVTIGALILPYALQIPQDTASTWALAHGGAVAGYIVAAAYIAGRAYVKGKTLQALGEHALADAQAREALALVPQSAPSGELRGALALARAADRQDISDPGQLRAIVKQIAAASTSAQLGP